MFEDDLFVAATQKDELILKQFGSKFSSLEKLILKFTLNIGGQIDRKIILFWRLLKRIIMKNNVQVELELDRSNPTCI